jgi:hypothetical protein
MADTTVFVQADPFAGKIQTVAGYIPKPDVVYYDAVGRVRNASDGATTLQSELRNMPRPIMGVQVKPNTPAYAQVVDQNGDTISVLNRVGSYTGTTDPAGRYNDQSFKSSDTAQAWTAWMLQSVREERMEKTQLVETFGDSYLYAYGEKPRSLQFQGLLLNTEDYDWKTDFWKNWEDHFRATKLVERKARMYIRFEDVLVEGYPINASVGQTAESPNAMSFSFLFFVTSYVNTRDLQKSARPRPFVFSTNLNLQARERAGIDLRSSQQVLQRKFSQAGLSDALSDLILGESGTASRTAQLANLAAQGAAGLGLDALKASAGGGTAALQSLYVNLARSGTALAQYVAATEIQSTGLTLQDFNAWFGFAGGLLTLATDVVVSASGTIPSSATQDSDATTILKEALTAGSVDALISKLGYAAGSAMLESTQDDNATTNANARTSSETSVSVKSAQAVSKALGSRFEVEQDGVTFTTAAATGTSPVTNVIEL